MSPEIGVSDGVREEEDEQREDAGQRDVEQTASREPGSPFDEPGAKDDFVHAGRCGGGSSLVISSSFWSSAANPHLSGSKNPHSSCSDDAVRGRFGFGSGGGGGGASTCANTGRVCLTCSASRFSASMMSIQPAVASFAWTCAAGGGSAMRPSSAGHIRRGSAE